jgi:hypothetical protein
LPTNGDAASQRILEVSVLICGLDLNYQWLIVADMGKTLRKAEMVYVDPDRFELLAKLAKDALEDLLIKHGALKAKQRS